ncbi:hypothetical protein [Candidatus Chloroploca asiatica]|uniref:Glycosyltransferase RgtA/B/C/D-like domain-containing protein n=1 Tax=Candidatus Chloroploca asiatica TaxID=1506545 RepID=A0A2H3KGS1_9CHLR|nr:hypothetical protein [Candidatus Chloroploca asiatica]PDV96919.1 hypothetical protein A9Q02_19750 [Candidatus Chloroploca asiatica]
MEVAPTRLRLRTHLGILAAYAVLALWLTWPAILALPSHYFTAGNNLYFYIKTPDAPQNIWNFWWTGYAVQHGINPFFTPLLYYPEGLQMVLQTINPVAVLTAVPVTLTLGPVAAYNVTAIVAMMLTGYAGFLLARAFAPGVLGPFVAGVLLTASPFHVAKLDSGQLNFVTMQWLVFAVVALIYLSRKTSWWFVPITALAFGAVLYTDWYWALVTVLFGMVWAVVSLIRAEQPLGVMMRYGFFGGLALLITLPLILMLRNELSDPNLPLDLWALYTQGYSADLLGLFFPSGRHPFWSMQAEQFLVEMAPYGMVEGSYTAAGWVLSALGLLGIFWYGRQHWRLIVVAVVAWLFAMGPILYILGNETGIPMPYQLLQALPGLSTARRPNLFGVLTIMVFTIFAALAVARMRERMRPRTFGIVLAVIGVLAFVELLPPIRTTMTMERAEVYAQIAAREPGVVVDLPIENNTNSRTLINQIVHGQPILRGYVARPPYYPTLLYSPLPEHLGRMLVLPKADIIRLDADALAAMQCYYQLRYVVIEPALTREGGEDRARAVMARLGGDLTPWYDDGRFRAYELPLHQDRCAPFVFLGEGWHDFEQNEAYQWRWSKGVAEFFLVNPTNEEATLTLTMRAEGRSDGQQVELWAINGEKMLASFALYRERRDYQFTIQVPAGMHEFELRTSVTPEEGTPRELGMAVYDFRVE